MDQKTQSYAIFTPILAFLPFATEARFSANNLPLLPLVALSSALWSFGPSLAPCFPPASLSPRCPSLSSPLLPWVEEEWKCGDAIIADDTQQRLTSILSPIPVIRLTMPSPVSTSFLSPKRWLTQAALASILLVSRKSKNQEASALELNY